MSVAYFIVLDIENVGFDTFVNGKSLANCYEDLTAFCNSEGLKTIDEFVSQDVSEFLQEFEEMELPDQEVLWFSAEEGIDWVTSLLDKLDAKSPEFSTDMLVEDLQEYLEVLRKSKNIGAKWHLEMDF